MTQTFSSDDSATASDAPVLAWPLGPELLARIDDGGLVIRYGGRAFQFRRQDVEVSRHLHTEYAVIVDGRVAALIERYGDFEAGVHLPTRKLQAAIVVRSLDHVVQLIARGIPAVP